MARRNAGLLTVGVLIAVATCATPHTARAAMCGEGSVQCSNWCVGSGYDGSGAAAVYGQTEGGWGVQGVDTNGGTGVLGVSDESGCVQPSGEYGGYFESPSLGVYGTATNTTSGSSVGVKGNGATYGVYGLTSTSGADGVFGHNTNSGSGVGVYGTDDGTGDGVHGSGASGNGVYGSTGSATGYGVYGLNANEGGTAVYGNASNTTSGTGVYGVGFTYGVYGSTTASGGDGVYGTNSAASGAAVYGNATSSGYGVKGASTSGDGVYGTTSKNAGGFAAGYFTTSAGTNSTAVAAINTSTGGGTGLYAQAPSGGTAGVFSGSVSISTTLAVTGSVTIGGNLTISGSCTGCSDIRLKKNVKPLEGALDQLLQLKGMSYEWKDPSEHQGDSGTVHGFVAQDVEKVFPSWVKQDGYTAPDGQKYRTLELRQIEALEVESIRTLKAENDALRAETANLEGRLAALESGRKPVAWGTNFNGLGFGVAGIALAGALVFSRRRRGEERQPAA
jgi:hypothetical protein